MIKQYSFKALLQNRGWIENVTISVDENGIIQDINNKKAENSIYFDGYALPGFQNAHSHGFQYAMAGLAETHELLSNPDDFWSWRDSMYKIALSVNPNQMQSIAEMLYSEMLKNGYTNVAEFHYVHHDKNGNHYSNLSEMGERMIEAAKNTGINITLIPIFYQKGGFGKSPSLGQRRFISSDSDEYLRLFEASEKSCKHYLGANTAIGIHSMRGVEPSIIKEIAKKGNQKIPFHIHISEQLKEIKDSIAYLGKRPVEWMLENIEMSSRFHLVHATHLVEKETKGIAKSGANVVLCPSTEGNLGDGIFPLQKFQEFGGNWSIGTDSHIGLNPLEEFRILDYAQRLISHKRNTFTSKKQGNSALFALDMALKTGRKGMGNFEEEYFKKGTLFNAFVFKNNSPLIESSSIENIANTLLYSSDSLGQLATFSRGKKVVENGVHTKYKEIKTRFLEVMKELNIRS